MVHATFLRLMTLHILPYFNNRIAAEIRMPEAIDRKLLCPFQYFGVTDTVDLDNLKWTNGGYDKGELSRIYTLSGMMANRRADLVVSSLLKYVTDIDDVKGLGFCVTIEHAEFMSDYFNAHGIPSMFLTGKSPDEERKEAKNRLVSGDVRFIFVVDKPVDVGFDCPLDLHCTYTRDQLLVALEFMKPSTVREGVKWLPEKNIDVFFVTLNKADKDYSPTTMYNDYSINSELFHWQSQSTTAADSPTGQRYIHHREKGSRVLLFVREFKTDRISGSAAAYTYLGTANYVKHDGEKPMNITWKLDHPIPAKYLKKTNKLVVG